MSERKERCETCKFYCRHPEQELEVWEGECRRSAPRPAPRRSLIDAAMNVDHYHLWPIVADDDWCGEWQART